MKISSARAPARLDRRRARDCLLANLLALPGLGTWLAGQRLVGGLQAALGLLGFLLTGAYFAWLGIHWMRTREFTIEINQYLWISAAGVFLFLLAWLWGLLSGLGLLQKARRNEAG